MKRLISILLTVTLLISAIALVSCEDEEHVHTFKETVVAPTCLNEGYTEYTCTGCDYVRRDTIVPVNPDAHDWQKTETVDPGHDDVGYTVEVCSHCGAERHVDYTETVHNMGEWVLVDAPLCPSDEGVYKRVCTDIGCNYYEEKLDKAEHKIDCARVVEPTATEAGYTLHSCQCGKYSYKDTYVNPTLIGYVNYEVRSTSLVGDENPVYVAVIFGLNKDDNNNYILPAVNDDGEVVVTIPESCAAKNGASVATVTTINYSAFSGLSGIDVISLPSTITEIRVGAFSRLDGVEIHYNGTVAQWQEIEGSNAVSLKVVCTNGYIEKGADEVPGVAN